MVRLPSRAAHKAEGGRKLAVIGGRLEDDNEKIFGEMHRLSGGNMLIFPTASSEPEAVGQESLEAFQAHGFTAQVAPLFGDAAPDLAYDPALIDMISAAGGIYFSGGDQANILAALAPGGMESPALSAIRAAQDAGALLAGSSAGAAMMSQPMMMGGTSLEAVIHGVTEDPEKPGLLMGDGLGFFPFGMVDQHFIKRGRLGRMVVAMVRAGVTHGYGVDENTALILEGAAGHVVGEYGVMMIDLEPSFIDPRGRTFQDVSLSYLDDGDRIDMRNRRVFPGAGKRRVFKRDMTYRAPIRSRRNVFAAYTLYDLMARLVLGDPSVYAADRSEAYDARSGFNVAVLLERVSPHTRCMIATPESGMRMTALDFCATINCEKLSATRIADRTGPRQARTYGMEPNPDAKIVLLGSSPLKSATEMLQAPLALAGNGPVGVLAAASAEPHDVAAEHVELLQSRGVEAVDLDVNIDTVEYTARDEPLLEYIESLQAIFICGGNQTRLVETLLHRGEESALLRAIARAHAKGATLIAASGAASALSGVMIAGGSTYEALRFGVSSDMGHQGLVIQEGIGLFSGGIIDQNLMRGERLGRLVVACAEEHERFGIGVFEDSSVIASHAGTRLEGAGRNGFVLIEIDPLHLVLQSDNFVANGIRLTIIGPGDSVDLTTNTVTRAGPAAVHDALLSNLVGGLAAEAGAVAVGERAGVKGVAITEGSLIDGTAVIDLECPRDEFG